MNWDQIKARWEEVCDRIRLTWGKLSEEDLIAIAGRRENLTGLLQERYGLVRVHAENKVDAFARELNLK